MTEASVSVESRAAGGGDLCSSSFGVRMGRMDGQLRRAPANWQAGGMPSGRPPSKSPIHTVAPNAYLLTKLHVFRAALPGTLPPRPR